MYQLRVEADFSAAHFLSAYNGKCERLHGHNYRVRLWIESETLNEGGMAADFALLKMLLKETLAPLDHSSLNELSEFDGNPSAERIARWIYEALAARFAAQGLAPALIAAVDVFESPSSMARYLPPERR
ncbi:MAG: 6-carboxytetrahydropterin synthase QueD [Treponema sp.]|jgi:6-pyruvoyltetrahydropterin/6-carboxytetrahydropterin synthase|nr:6-carboxytetrahydropterin synthase QueD [Treponema sp.]